VLCYDAMLRVVRPGAQVHILAEDYGMLFFAGTKPDTNPADFWHSVRVFGEQAGGDWMVGRSVLWEALHAAAAAAAGNHLDGTKGGIEDGEQDMALAATGGGGNASSESKAETVYVGRGL